MTKWYQNITSTAALNKDLFPFHEKYIYIFNSYLNFAFPLTYIIQSNLIMKSVKHDLYRHQSWWQSFYDAFCELKHKNFVHNGGQKRLPARKSGRSYIYTSHKLHIFQCMGKIFCVEFQRAPLKFHTKYFTHTLKDMIFLQCWKFTSSQIYKLVCIFDTPQQHKLTRYQAWLWVDLSHQPLTQRNSYSLHTDSQPC